MYVFWASWRLGLLLDWSRQLFYLHPALIPKLVERLLGIRPRHF